MTERIERLQKEHVILQSENIEVQNEIQKLQQKLQVMTELYQENEMNLHRYDLAVDLLVNKSLINLLWKVISL